MDPDIATRDTVSGQRIPVDINRKKGLATKQQKLTLGANNPVVSTLGAAFCAPGKCRFSVIMLTSS